MKRKSDIAVNALIGEFPIMATPKIRRQQERQQTLEWISTTALSTLRRVWRKA